MQGEHNARERGDEAGLWTGRVPYGGHIPGLALGGGSPPASEVPGPEHQEDRKQERSSTHLPWGKPLLFLTTMTAAAPTLGPKLRHPQDQAGKSASEAGPGSVPAACECRRCCQGLPSFQEKSDMLLFTYVRSLIF